MRDMNQVPDIVAENRSSSDSGGRKSPNQVNGAPPERPGSSPSSYHQRDKRHKLVKEIKVERSLCFGRMKLVSTFWKMCLLAFYCSDLSSF